MAPELAERDAPEVVAVRAEREEVRLLLPARRLVLERAPLRVEEADRMPLDDDEGGETDHRARHDREERDPARQPARMLREPDAPVGDGVDRSDDDPGEREHQEDRAA